jgi:ankyrin repeat protein
MQAYCEQKEPANQDRAEQPEAEEQQQQPREETEEAQQHHQQQHGSQAASAASTNSPHSNRPAAQQQEENQQVHQQPEVHFNSFKKLRQTVNARDLYRRTPLIVAAKQGHLNCTELLLEAAANLFAIDREGNT